MYFPIFVLIVNISDPIYFSKILPTFFLMMFQTVMYSTDNAA